MESIGIMELPSPDHVFSLHQLFSDLILNAYSPTELADALKLDQSGI